MKFILLSAFLLIVGVVYGQSSQKTDYRIVKRVELARYLGLWYEIARFDHSFERNLIEVTALYRLRDDGGIEVVNRGIDSGTGHEKIVHGKVKLSAEPGRLQVSFFWFFYADYDVLELDSNYQWAVVGSSSSKYLWVLSRRPQLPTATLNHILNLIEKQGYDTNQLLFVDQRQAIAMAEQKVGVSGTQTVNP